MPGRAFLNIPTNKTMKQKFTEEEINQIANRVMVGGLKLKEAQDEVLKKRAKVDKTKADKPKRKTADEIKEEFSKRILELGGKPPVTGSVAVYETAYNELRREIERQEKLAEQGDTNGGDNADNGASEPGNGQAGDETPSPAENDDNGASEPTNGADGGGEPSESDLL